jgi:hypothetical protein
MEGGNYHNEESASPAKGGFQPALADLDQTWTGAKYRPRLFFQIKGSSTLPQQTHRQP